SSESLLSWLLQRVTRAFISTRAILTFSPSAINQFNTSLGYQPSTSVVQKISLTAIVNKAHNSNLRSLLRADPTAKLPLGRGSTRSDRFYAPALIRPTSGSDGSCHPLWNLSAASHQRYWLPRNVRASSFMEFHDGYSRKVSAYTDLETALLTLF